MTTGPDPRLPQLPPALTPDTWMQSALRGRILAAGAAILSAGVAAEALIRRARELAADGISAADIATLAPAILGTFDGAAAAIVALTSAVAAVAALVSKLRERARLRAA